MKSLRNHITESISNQMVESILDPNIIDKTDKKVDRHVKMMRAIQEKLLEYFPGLKTAKKVPHMDYDVFVVELNGTNLGIMSEQKPKGIPTKLTARTELSRVMHDFVKMMIDYGYTRDDVYSPSNVDSLIFRKKGEPKLTIRIDGTQSDTTRTRMIIWRYYIGFYDEFAGLIKKD